MIVAFSKSRTEQYKAMSAWKTAYTESGATVHMAMNDTVLDKNKNSTSGSIGQASKEVVRAKSKRTSEYQLSRGTESIKLNRALHVSEIT